MTQKEKTKFRSTSKWKDFRQRLKKERKVDYITQRPLLKGFSVHHMDMSDEHYTDISNEDNFVCLNRKMHRDIVHELWRYYKKDPEVLTRLREILDKMCELND